MARPSRQRRRALRSAQALGVVAALVEQGLGDQNVSCNAATSWMNNVDGESPCTVANNLMLSCSGGSVFEIALLSGSNTTYNNPLAGQKCSCNTVVYNLISACAICQGGSPSNLEAWMNGCPSVLYESFTDTGVAQSYSTPQWAFVNVTSNGFDLDAVEKAAGVDISTNNGKKGWSPIQIALPIIIAVIVALGAGLFFMYYRWRMKIRYMHLADAQRTEYGHHKSASTSTIGIERLFSSLKRKPSRVAWEQANLQRPRRLGGLISDRRAVHPRRRGTDWSIDSDMDTPTNQGTHGDNTPPLGNDDGAAASGETRSSSRAATHGNLRQGHVSSTSLASRLSVTALNFLNNVGVGSAANSNGPTPAPTPGPTGEKGNSRPLSPDPPLRPIQDDPAAVRNAFVRPKPGVARGSPALPPIHVAGGLRTRGFHLDDIDSARSPTIVDNVHGRDASSVAELVSAASGALGAMAPTASGDAARSDGNVVLISRTPGQDFNSMASPVETDGMGEFHTASSENGALSAALSDSSSVLPDNISLISSGVFPRPPTHTHSVVPPVPNIVNPMERAPMSIPGPSNSSTPTPRLLVAVPPQTADPALLAPPVIRAAGGYSIGPPPSHALNYPQIQSQQLPQTVHGAGANNFSPLSATRTDRSGSIPLLPNAGLFAGSDIMSPASGFSWGYTAMSPSVRGPESAAVTDISHASQNSSTAATVAWSGSSQGPASSIESTAGAAAMLAPRVGTVPGGPMTFAPPSILSLASSSASIGTPSSLGPPSTHSSDQYTVPNPFTFTLPRGPASATVPNPLYVAFQNQQQQLREAQQGAVLSEITSPGPEIGSNNPFGPLKTKTQRRRESFDLDA